MPYRAFSQNIENPTINTPSTQLEAQFLQKMLGDSLSSAAQPQLPLQPTTPSVDSTSKNEEKKKPSIKEKVPTFPFESNIILEDGRIFKGTISLPNFTLSIRRVEKGYNFFKTINVYDILYITVDRWDVKQVVNPKQKSQSLFEPQSYLIMTKNGDKLTYQENIKELNKLNFTNAFGETIFFSYFVDYQQNKQWQNLKIPNHNKAVYTSLANVVRTIYFGKIPKILDEKKVIIKKSSSKKKVEKPLPMKS